MRTAIVGALAAVTLLGTVADAEARRCRCGRTVEYHRVPLLSCGAGRFLSWAGLRLRGLLLQQPRRHRAAELAAAVCQLRHRASVSLWAGPSLGEWALREHALAGASSPKPGCHGRACPDHPCATACSAVRGWLDLGTSPRMTAGRTWLLQNASVRGTRRRRRGGGATTRTARPRRRGRLRGRGSWWSGGP